ncbi:MAG: MBL fold metallo-hydrolase [Candidatus Syntrophopropionicum ammoniitolerans]
MGELDSGVGTGDQIVEPYLRRTGVHKLDVLVLSHPHEDHCGGAVWLIKRFYKNGCGYIHRAMTAQQRQVCRELIGNCWRTLRPGGPL